MDGILQARSDVVAFLEIPDTSAPEAKEYRRMQGFKTLSIAKNPKEYTRQYVDEKQEQTDVVGYSPSLDFSYDEYVGNPVHDYISEIINNEITGTAAVVNILTVDVTKPDISNNAYLRPYATIAGNAGDSNDAYTHSGSFKVKGNKVWGKATVSADGLTATFIPAAL